MNTESINTESMSTATIHSVEPPTRRAWPMRLWLAAPDWAFRAAGAGFFFVYIGMQFQKYRAESWEKFIPFCIFPGGARFEMPWVPILVDLTFVLIALSFCFRMPPRTRAVNGWVVSYSLLTAFAPLLLLGISPVLGLLDVGWQESYDAFMWRRKFTWQLAMLGGILLTIGNALDIWGYSTLWRSFSIVPEPRELKTTGPYRFVRHPVYLGQFLAQAAILLVSFRTHIVWISVYALFVAMQLYRSKLEDRVLEKAFGDPYREWQEKTFWFV